MTRAEAIEKRAREVKQRFDELKGFRPFYDPCGRGQVHYEITQETFEKLGWAVDDLEKALQQEQE